jgi:hypothetical protein
MAAASSGALRISPRWRSNSRNRSFIAPDNLGRLGFQAREVLLVQAATLPFLLDAVSRCLAISDLLLEHSVVPLLLKRPTARSRSRSAAVMLDAGITVFCSITCSAEADERSSHLNVACFRDFARIADNSFYITSKPLSTVGIEELGALVRLRRGPPWRWSRAPDAELLPVESARLHPWSSLRIGFPNARNYNTCAGTLWLGGHAVACCYRLLQR